MGGGPLGQEGVVSIRALPAEGDPSSTCGSGNRIGFQSAPSLRRATGGSSHLSTIVQLFQSAPSLRRATPDYEYEYGHLLFQSAPSLRRATRFLSEDIPAPRVSIRALPAEGDASTTRSPTFPRRFNPRPPCGGRLMLALGGQVGVLFQSAPSLRRATFGLALRVDGSAVSIRALPAEGDDAILLDWGYSACFNPRPPCGGRHGARAPNWRSPRFNPRPPCGGRPGPTSLARCAKRFQSAPSLRRATAGTHRFFPSWRVSIRALPAEGDLKLRRRLPVTSRFQSAPSLRRATRCRSRSFCRRPCFNPRPPCGGRHTRVPVHPRVGRGFNPRPPCGGRRGGSGSSEGGAVVSIRALPAEGDLAGALHVLDHGRFNPRPPCGGRRADQILNLPILPVSIRALPAEGDSKRSRRVTKSIDVSIRALPAEGDDRFISRAAIAIEFQSAPSLRRATRRRVRRAGPLHVSIRALPAEGDCARRPIPRKHSAFQSAPSLRRATVEAPAGRGPGDVSIRALPAEGDKLRGRRFVHGDVSIRALPAEGDNAPVIANDGIGLFQSAPSLRRATRVRKSAEDGLLVSIRALPAEGDHRS